VSTGFVARLAEALRVPQEKMVHPPRGGSDLYTSSLAYALKAISQSERVRPGDVGLIVGVGSGIQVGCATYHF
jgi:3-oxoacyl-[acyl-carrier-protein] synthase III